MAEQFLLIRNGYYFRPGERGYTARKAEAGRFWGDYAQNYCDSTEGVAMVRADLADEVAPVTVGGTCPDPNLERDAVRYRWLRGRGLETIEDGGVFAGRTPENVVLNGEDLDLAIDAAMAR